MGRHRVNGHDVMDVALVTSQGGSNVEMDMVWHKNEEKVMSESGGVAFD